MPNLCLQTSIHWLYGANTALWTLRFWYLFFERKEVQTSTGGRDGFPHAGFGGRHTRRMFSFIWEVRPFCVWCPCYAAFMLMQGDGGHRHCWFVDSAGAHPMYTGSCRRAYRATALDTRTRDRWVGPRRRKGGTCRDPSFAGGV